VLLKLSLNLEAISKGWEEVDHTVVAPVVGAGTDIPLLGWCAILLEVGEDRHMDRGEEPPVDKVLVLPTVGTTEDVVLLPEAHLTAFELVSRLGIVHVLHD